MFAIARVVAVRWLTVTLRQQRVTTRSKKNTVIVGPESSRRSTRASRRPSNVNRTDVDKERSGTVKRRRQTTQAQLKIKHATSSTVLIREAKDKNPEGEKEKEVEKARPIPLRLRFNSQEAVRTRYLRLLNFEFKQDLQIFHCGPTETVETFLAFAVNRIKVMRCCAGLLDDGLCLEDADSVQFKGHLRPTTSLELLTENHVALQLNDILSTHPSIVKSLSSKVHIRSALNSSSCT